ncbi:glycosyltransferase family 4 protein [Microbacterium sp.]|uniref:glycosyltransferase family 4 protein n=1 Tax=Microbacterium sp. TaxID=51671 RepID=UPI003A8B8059
MQRHSATQRPLRVVHLDHTVEPGGAELALVRLVSGAHTDWVPCLAVPAPDGCGVFSAAADAGVKMVSVGAAQAAGAATAGFAGAGRFAGAILHQAAQLRWNKTFRGADVVHANSTRSAVYGALAVWGRRVPLVVHLRDRIEPTALGRPGYAMFRLTALRRATSFIANSESTADTVRPFLRKGQRVVVIPSPAGVDRGEPLDGSTTGPVRIGMVARLDEWKGQREVLEAFSRAELGSRASLTFFGAATLGTTAYPQMLRQRAQGHDNVHFAGHVDDVSAAIDGLDLCVQYSTRPEPMGQNVLQYLARARPVVAANEGGPAEWITSGDNGVLVPPRDVAALARTFAELVGDPQLRVRLSRGAAKTSVPTDADSIRAHSAVFQDAVRRFAH